MSAAATKASITLHFAIEGNMADLNAKESTQETLVSLVGMICGVTLARWLKHYEISHPEFMEQIQWLTFILLTGIHVWANWKGVCLLRLRSLNRERAEMALSSFITTITTRAMDNGRRPGSGSVSGSTPRDDSDPCDGGSFLVPSPEHVNESLMISTIKMIFHGRIRFNCRLMDIVRDGPSPDYLAWCLSHQQKHILSVNRRRVVKVCLLQGATNADQIHALCHALCLLQSSSLSQEDWQTRAMDYGKVLHNYFHTNPQRSLVARLKQAGWDTEGRLYLGFSRRRTELVKKDD